MCWAVPAVVVEIDKENNIAIVDFGGVRQEVLVGVEDVKPGDVVLVHAGLIISKVDMEALEEYKKLIEEIEKALNEVSEGQQHQQY